MPNSVRYFLSVLLGVCVLMASCGSSSDLSSDATDSPTSDSTTRQTPIPVREDPPSLTPAEPPVVVPTAVEALVGCGPEDTPLVASYLRSSGRCPSPEQLEELAYIWEQNRDFWTDFPAQQDSFVKNNTAAEGRVVLDELVGLSVEQASALLSEDATLSMTLDSGATQVGTMSLYEFSGGLTLLLMVERDDVVVRVYTFDLG